MKNTLKLALSIVLGATLVAPAFAQNFPDVRENHWAYQALENLKDKVLFGYPDGLYRGAKEMTRYEFAVAINALWQRMSSQFDGIDARLRKLEAGSGTGTGADSDARQQIAELRREVEGMKGWSTAIADLQKLTKEFEKELSEMGVRVDEMEKGMADLKSRVEALEKKENAITIGANVDLVVLAGNSNNNRFGLMPNGQIVGAGRDDYAGVPVGMTRDLTILHEAALTLKGGKDGQPKWNAVLLIGNVMDSLGNFNAPPAGQITEASGDIAFAQFAVSFDAALLGQGVSAQIGRVGHQAGKYIWQRPAYSSLQYSNELRDNGNWIFDGGILGFNFGAAKLNVFGGRNSDRLSVNGADINPSSLYQGVIGDPSLDTTLGVQLHIPIAETGKINLAYLWQDSNSTNNVGFGTYNRRNTFGAEAMLNFSGIDVYGAYSQTTISENTSNRLDSDNAAYEVALKYGTGALNFGAGFRRIEENFAADGAWGRIGTLWNPRDVEGFNAMVSFAPSSDLTVYGKGEFLSGIKAGGLLGSNDDVNSLTFGLDYKLSNSFNLGLSYEDVKWDFNTGTDPHQRWYTFKLGYNMSDSAKLMFTYTYSDVDAKGRALPFTGGGRFTGGLLGTQIGRAHV